MKKIMCAILYLALQLPVGALANMAPYPGCGMAGKTDLNNLAGIVFVSFSVGIVLYTRRR